MIDLAPIRQVLSGDTWPTHEQVQQAQADMEAMYDGATEAERDELRDLQHWAFQMYDALQSPTEES